MAVSELGWNEVSHLPSLGNGDLTILLGAGASAPCNLPEWNKMVSNLLLNTGVVDDIDTAKLATIHGDLVLLAEAARAKCANEHEWISALSAALYGHPLAIDMLHPSSMHFSAALAAWKGAGNVHLATLNFDQLLEQALTEMQMTVVDEDFEDADHDKADHYDGLSLKEPKVEHLHGLIPIGSRPARIAPEPVFSFYDYLRQLQNPSALARDYLAKALENGSLLIAGTSFRDPDMRQWLASILSASTNRRKHKACILLAREGYPSVDKSQFEKLVHPLRAQWMALGFDPIFVDDYEDVAQLLRECPHVHQDGYLSPQDRIDRIWNRFMAEDDFAELQPLISKRLRDNKAQLKDDIQRHAGLSVRMNATLWIAHRDRLYRYATHDRIYVKSDLLKFQNVGFDSKYIAGQAYGSNSPCYIVLDQNDGEWKTILACPISIQPKSAAWATSLPIGVLSFGINQNIDTHTDKVMNKIVDLCQGWSEKLENRIEETGIFP